MFVGFFTRLKMMGICGYSFLLFFSIPAAQIYISLGCDPGLLKKNRTNLIIHVVLSCPYYLTI